MSYRAAAQALLGQLGNNVVTATAYDTAWVAAVPTLDGAQPVFAQSLAWLRAHQHPDGSWGGPWSYYHDRLVSTLRAVLTLHQWRSLGDPADQISAGLAYIRRHLDDLAGDPWETVGFELIFPMLLDAAQAAGLPLPYNAAAIAPIRQDGQAKLARVSPDRFYDRRLPLGVNLEALGADFNPARAPEIQEAIGGVGMSPSATAFLLQHCPDNRAALHYLAAALYAGGANGSVSSYYPLETFERSWAVYQFQHVLGDDLASFSAALAPSYEFLAQTALPTGWTSSRYSSIKEVDTTAVCFALLSQAGHTLDPHLLYQYEDEDCFRCYPFERNPSISANAHVLDALRYCAPAGAAPRQQKVLDFLGRMRRPEGYWFDKWHVSPYYATSHVLLATTASPALGQPAVDWIIRSQRADGSWGYYAPTLEETAYALLALCAWREGGRPIPCAVLARGAAYLAAHFDPAQTDFPPLWIAKALYIPVQVVQAAILAALLAWERIAGARVGPNIRPS